MTLEELKQKVATSFGYSDFESILTDYKAGEINDKIFKGIIDNLANGFAMVQVLDVAQNALNAQQEQEKTTYSRFQDKLQQKMAETVAKRQNGG